MIDLRAWGHVVADAITHPPQKVAAPFRPTFESPLWHGLNGTSGPLNPDYFATEETAKFLSDRYGAVGVVEQAFIADGGPFWTEPKMRILMFFAPDGTSWSINAGWMAAYYRAFPEDEFPGLADRYCRVLIDKKGVL